MRSLQFGARIRLIGASLVAAGLVAYACAKVEKPAAPSQTSYPTITITDTGISKDGPALVPGMAVKVVNAGSQIHRLHLDLGDQPGCGNIDSGDIAPGESRLTAPVGDDVTKCAAHDHMHHGDPRFQIKLSADSGE
jgi:hypothetical protein